MNYDVVICTTIGQLMGDRFLENLETDMHHADDKAACAQDESTDRIWRASRARSSTWLIARFSRNAD